MLSERILSEVARNTEVRSWLPKIEIAKRPVSPDCQLFTPSSKAPAAASRRRCFTSFFLLYYCFTTALLALYIRLQSHCRCLAPQVLSFLLQKYTY